MNLKDNEVTLVKIYTSTGVDTVSFDDYQKALDVINNIKHPLSDFLLVGNVCVRHKEIIKVVIDKGEKMIEATYVLGNGENQLKRKLYFKTEEKMKDFDNILKEHGISYVEPYTVTSFKVNQ